MRPILLACAVVLTVARPLAAQTTDNLLLVVNTASADSIAVGEYYARKRAVPSDRIVRIRTATTETVGRDEYARAIEAPIADFLVRSDLQDRILYIVITKGVPLRVVPARDPGDAQNTVVASVDSELTLLYRRLLGQDVPLVGRLPNPYFLGSRPVSEAKPFTRFDADVYLVTRLDGFTVEDVVGLIDRGSSPSQEGQIVLDQRASLTDAAGDGWLKEAADRVDALSAARAILETSNALAPNPGAPILGYYSWGSNDSANRLRRFGLRFSPGAIGGMFVSTDGRTMAEPPADWTPADSTRRARPFQGSHQSLAADLVRDGITGVSAHVSEPFLDATARPQILFPAYLAGSNLAEAFYLAMPYLSWQTIVIGDPLCAPFRRTPLTAVQLHGGVEPETGIPVLYGERRLAVLKASGLDPDALKLTIQARAEQLRGNLDVVEALLVKATTIEPHLTSAHLGLALIFDESGRRDRAIVRYRRVLALHPRNLIALNNLAFALAVHKGAPQEALPLAKQAYAALHGNLQKEMSVSPEQAFTAAGDVPFVADTLGWILHLLGDDRAAAPFIDEALAAANSRHAEVLLHAAVVHAAIGQTEKARRELDAAVQLDPSLAETPAASKLRSTKD
jgi:uncharacterized protein (TIGR03790 family)